MSFDVRTGHATLNGYSLFALQTSKGTLTVAPSSNLTDLFDRLQEAGTRASIDISCTFFGFYEWQAGQAITPVYGNLSIHIEDDTCWKETPQNGLAWYQPLQTVPGNTAGKCRASCRSASDCGLYHFSGSTCEFVAPCNTPAGPNCQHIPAVFEKITNCSKTTTCLELFDPSPTLYPGLYCPLGSTVNPQTGQLLGYAYDKVGLTSEGSFYLQPGDGDSCPLGSLLLRRPNATWDFVNVTSHIVELHGEPVTCLSSEAKVSKGLLSAVFDAGSQEVQASDDSSLVLSLESPSCSLNGLNLTVDGTSVTVASSQEAIFVDDPSTSIRDDFSLHPCECFPENWGSVPPVVSASFKQVPPGSQNLFRPQSVQILQGSAMCQQESLLTIKYGSNDVTACQVACSTQHGCLFFWAGSVHGGKQCRMYSACEALVQPENAQGSLLAAFSNQSSNVCHRADPQQCFAIRLRRMFLGAGTGGHLPGGGCPFEALARQCDWHLMLGMTAVQACYQCDYAFLDDRDWQHKRHLPSSFPSGQQLRISCWEERYAPVTLAETPGLAADSYTVTCAGGSWSGPAGRLLSEFSCGACVQLVQPRYDTYYVQQHQELYFTPSVVTGILVDGQEPMFVNSSAELMAIAQMQTCLRYTRSSGDEACLALVERTSVEVGNRTCEPPQGQWFLCTASGDRCLFDLGNQPGAPLELYKLGEFFGACPRGICHRDYTAPCADSELQLAVAETSLLQLKAKRERCYVPVKVARAASFTTKTRNGTDYSTFALRSVSEGQCLDLSDQQLKPEDCEEPMSPQQGLSVAVLRDFFQAQLQARAGAPEAIPCSHWPTAEVGASCPGGALTGINFGVKQAPCSTTPIAREGTRPGLTTTSALQFVAGNGSCLIVYQSQTVAMGSCMDSTSFWRFIDAHWEYPRCLQNAALETYLHVVQDRLVLNRNYCQQPASFSFFGIQLIGFDGSAFYCLASKGLSKPTQIVDPCRGHPVGTMSQRRASTDDFGLTCPVGMLLSSFHKPPTGEGDPVSIDYTCVRATTMGSCQSVSASSDFMQATCPQDTALQSVIFKKGPTLKSQLVQPSQWASELRRSRLEHHGTAVSSAFWL